ncbi:MAG: hypothetical protein ACOY94_09460 [Bacillota bacterium]
MNFEAIFKRFINDWQKFLMMGLGPLIVNFAVGAIGTVIMLVLVGPSIFNLIRMDAMGMAPSSGSMFGLIGSFVGAFVVMMLVAVVAFGLSTAGLMGSVAGYRRGEEVSIGSFWGHATRHYGKVILIGLILGVIMMVSMILMIIPVLGWLAMAVWGPTAAVVLGLYPAHLAVNAGMSVGDSVGAGFKVLTAHFKEALIGGLIMLGFGIALSMIGMIPLVGWIVGMLFGQPLITYFFVERFELEVRPKLPNLPPVV